jgi:hypothetical protein
VSVVMRVVILFGAHSGTYDVCRSPIYKATQLSRKWPIFGGIPLPPSSRKNTDTFLLDRTVYYSPEEGNIRATCHCI